MEQNINEYLNKIGKWWLEGYPDKEFYAQLVFEEENCSLKSEIIGIDLFRFLYNEQDKHYSKLIIYGEIEGTKFSLLMCSIKNGYTKQVDKNDIINGWICGMFITPAEIVYGGFHATNTTAISVSIVEFEQIEEFIHFETYKYNQLEGVKFIPTNNISIKTANFTINISAHGKHEWNQNQFIFTNKIIVEFIFENKTSIDSMRKEIAIFRMLLSVLKLKILQIINVQIIKNNFEGFTETYSNENIAYYYMNYSTKECKEIWPVPEFCIRYDIINSDFEGIVNKWYGMYSDAQPIVSLFYEVLTEKSTGINKFLNLSQALEVYSNMFRKDEVKALFVENERPKNPSKEPYLFYKILDLLLLLNCCLNLKDDHIRKLAQDMSDTRNYYTHYNKTKKQKALPYTDMFMVSRFMDYALLMLICLNLGIKMDVLKEKFYHPFYKSTLKDLTNKYNSIPE